MIVFRRQIDKPEMAHIAQGRHASIYHVRLFPFTYFSNYMILGIHFSLFVIYLLIMYLPTFTCTVFHTWQSAHQG